MKEPVSNQMLWPKSLLWGLMLLLALSIGLYALGFFPYSGNGGP